MNGFGRVARCSGHVPVKPPGSAEPGAFRGQHISDLSQERPQPIAAVNRACQKPIAGDDR
ncbi:hypothetical protein CHELA20_53487 [Hyphomicrobiales bacterium]|nr:hypothetical protein CHELA41_21441 [Hyphomicrobiales bacterium]CAH1684348.1 hypothetical protein CHELA20_53487 [Hyphomicrobiales bacterium]